MQYWLMKSEPDVFGIDDLQKVGIEPWDGVRNYQARNMMRDQIQVGDQVFFYHSNCDVPGIVRASQKLLPQAIPMTLLTTQKPNILTLKATHKTHVGIGSM